MGLFYRTADRVIEHQRKAKELQKKNDEREKKLNDIEQKFKDVKASAEGLVAELEKTLKSAKDGAEMAKVIVDRYDEAQARIRALESDKASLEVKNTTLVNEKASLVTKIEDAYERATVKARYDLLKDYKQGLLVEAEIDEEIEVYELLDDKPPVQTTEEIEPPAQVNPEVDPSIMETSPEDRNVRD